MEYKICENCGEQLHVRTQICPVCDTVLTEKSQVVKEIDEIVTDEKQEEVVEQQPSTEDFSTKIPTDENDEEINKLPSKDMKDYVYKAEVRHSLEYTKLMSNGLKVFLAAISMVPVIGQFIGTFFGVFFLTYDDSDRKSFGKALVLLSVIMFFIYFYNIIMFERLIEVEGLANLIKGM